MSSGINFFLIFSGYYKPVGANDQTIGTEAQKEDGQFNKSKFF
jgi:hypothetical protein